MSKAEAVYLLLGPEEGEKEKFVEELKARLARERGGSLETVRAYPFDTDLVEVLAQLQNGALFSSHRLTILNNLEAVGRERDIRLLAEYCARPARQATLVLVSAETRLGERFAKLEKAIPAENRKVFWELFESQKTGWIANFFRQRGLRIDPQATRFLLDMVENNTKQLQETCESLALFFGDKKGEGIGLEEVEKILYHSKEENVFTLFNRVAQRDLASALEILQKILLSRDGESTQLLAGLLSQFRRVKLFQELLRKSYSAEEAFRRLKLSSKRAQRVFQEAARRYSLAEVEAIVMLTAAFDMRLRGFKTNHHPALLQLFLYYAIQRGGRGAWRESEASLPQLP